MSELGAQIIFTQLLERHQRVHVPMIQRDYAQGRETQEEVREGFLSALHGALTLPPEDALLPLNLDFIYGSVEGDNETRFLPLDGQQRLTTLFLLHWYLAWKDNCYDKFQEVFCPEGGSRFSYSVRPSSAEFFNALVKFCPDLSPADIPSLKAVLTNQPWYFRYWRLDPTIQSSLTMLDAIHANFRESDGFYSRLVDTEQPAITFQLLDLENFGLSDDLYIKMNARGKPLTVFETFKARYEQELGSLFDGELRSIGGQSFPVAEYFGRRMDTQWADFFWTHRDEETNLYDEAVINLFRAVVMVTREPGSDSYLDDIVWLRNRWETSSYSIFHSKGWLDRIFSETLFMLLEAWSRGGAEFVFQLPDTRYFHEEELFMKAVSEPTGFAYAELVQFVGYVVFMREHIDDLDPDAFQEWMRIVFNLSANTSYERPADMQRSMTGLLKLVSHSGNILGYFVASEKPTTGFNIPQIAEEKLKAKLIQSDVAWRPLIDRAEGHAYFRGQIEFLLEFCGAVEKSKSSDCIDWGADTHASLQEKFEKYLKAAEIMFNARGLVSVDGYRWERALLSIGDYTLSSGSNKSFLVNPLTDPVSWKRLLRSPGAELLQQLWGRITVEGPLDNQLDAIIDSATELEPWREAFVNTPEAIGYCKKRAFRLNSGNNVYLLSKSQMNGAHAELYTYCLYHSHLTNMFDNGDFAHLKLMDYESVNETEIEPGVRFRWSYNEEIVYFDLERQVKNYIIYVALNSLEELPQVKEYLCDMEGFVETENRVIRTVSESDIQASLCELAGALATTFSQDSSDS